MGRIKVYLLTISLTLFSSIYLLAIPAFAHGHHTFHEKYDALSNESKEEVNKILDSLKTDLIQLGMTFPKTSGFHEKFNALDKNAKEEVEAILDQFEDKKLTKEEANKQLKPYGLELPDKAKCQLLEDIDAATKKKAEDIFKQLKDGSITKEEAEKQLSALGISLPKNPLEESFNQLNEETKTKVITRVKNAKEQLEKLGVPLPRKYNFLIK